MPKELFLDFETASEVDLEEVGTLNYAQHPSTRPLMCSWAIDDGEVHLWEPDLGPMPERLRRDLLDPAVLKLSWNVKMERSILKYCLEIDIPITQWFDVMVLARYCSLPGKLKDACFALNLPMEVSKHAEAGDECINMFCFPVRMGGKETLFGIEPAFFNTRQNKPEEWKRFCEYCRQDTFVERYIYRGLRGFMLPQKQIDLWYLDQVINERGMPVNMKVVRNALKMALESIESVRKRLQDMTGLENPNSDQKMLAWLQAQGYSATSMNKKVVKVALADPNLTPLAQEVLLIRQEFKRSSYTKLENILKRISPDDRLRDCFAYMGASRTGRWSGQDVQFQNLARPDKKVEENLTRVLELIGNADMENALKEFSPKYKIGGKEYILPSVLGMVVSCLRSIFEAKQGKILVVSDLSSIENRVLGWLAGCNAILEVFRKNLDSYKAFAVLMYCVTYEEVTKAMRQIAKVPVLGCGYGLGPGVTYHQDTGEYEIIWQCDECLQRNVSLDHRCLDEKGNRIGDLVKTGLLGYAENMGVQMTPEQAYKAWKAFREAYPEIPALWSAVERAAVDAIRTGKKTKPQIKKRGWGYQEEDYQEIPFIEFSRVKRRNGQFVLRCLLPSGRYLHYINARVTEEEKVSQGGRKYVKYNIYYDGIGHGVGATTHKTSWAPVYTYGGKLVENIVQAISRDILTEGMLRTEEIGMPIVGHCHDEIIVEVDDDLGRAGLGDLNQAMAAGIDWAPGLPLGADGFEGMNYRK
jgi:DNA polymerase bacteriophage-type